MTWDEREQVELDGAHASVEQDRASVDRWLVRVGETHPGVVAKLRAVWGDLEADIPSRRTMAALALILHAMAADLDARSNAPLSPH